MHLPIIVSLLAGAADTVAGSDAEFSEGRSVSRAGVLDYSEKQEETDYVDDKYYYEIVGQKTQDKEIGEWNYWQVTWFETNQFPC
jgi:hypothetical protein